MSAVRVFSGPAISGLVDLSALRGSLVDAFVALTKGEADVPPRVGARAARGLVGAMPGYLPGAGLVLKAVTVFPGNAAASLPAHQGVVLVFDERDGRPLAILDAAAVTELRTSAAAALAAELLARDDAAILTIVGAGVQARGHLAAFAALRPWDEIRVVSRTHSRAVDLAAAWPDVRVFDDPRAAVEGADVVALCTDSRDPVIQRDWLAPGAHLSSVGTGHELPPEAITSARVVVEWRGAATNPPPAGAAELQAADPADLVELGELLMGTAPGRRGADEITVYKSTGHAVEDAAAARYIIDTAGASAVATVEL